MLCCSMYCLFVSFYVLFLCKCILYFCHRVTTQLQLTNISYIYIYIYMIYTRWAKSSYAVYSIVLLCTYYWPTLYIRHIYGSRKPNFTPN